jgi:hypothetical protein
LSAKFAAPRSPPEMPALLLLEATAARFGADGSEPGGESASVVSWSFFSKLAARRWTERSVQPSWFSPIRIRITSFAASSMKTPMLSGDPMTVPKSVSFGRSGSLGGGGLGVGGGGAATTGGDGGRRDGEKIGRARVSCNELRATPHKGLPVNELSCRGRAGVVTALTAGRSSIPSGAYLVTSSNREIVSARAPPRFTKAPTSSAVAPQVRQPAVLRAFRCVIIAHSRRGGSNRSGLGLAAERSILKRSPWQNLRFPVFRTGKP